MFSQVKSHRMRHAMGGQEWIHSTGKERCHGIENKAHWVVIIPLGKLVMKKVQCTDW